MSCVRCISLVAGSCLLVGSKVAPCPGMSRMIKDVIIGKIPEGRGSNLAATVSGPGCVKTSRMIKL
jgi:hypothetical protein